MKSRLHLLALLGALTLWVGACSLAVAKGGDGGEGRGGELVWAVGGAEAQVGGTHQQVVELWNAEHPGTPVRIEILPDRGDEQHAEQARVLQGGQPEYDLLAMEVIWTGEYAVKGWVESVEDRRAELEEAGVLPGPLASAQWGGELWAVPYNSDSGLFYYRTDLIDAAPATWEQARRVCTAAAEKAGIAPYVAQGAQYEGLVVNFLEYLLGAGGRLINEDGTRSLLTEGDAGRTALEFMATSQAEGFYAPGFNRMLEDEAVAEFQSGHAACMRNWPSFYGQLAGEGKQAEASTVRDRTGVAPLPTFTGEGTTGVTGGLNIGVSAFSDDVEAAKDFAVWTATDDEVQQLLGEGSLPPVKRSAYEELSADDPVLGLVGEVLADPKTAPRPPAPAWRTISEAMQRTIYPTYNGEIPVDEALVTLDEEINAALARSRGLDRAREDLARGRAALTTLRPCRRATPSTAPRRRCARRWPAGR
jgi:multiple sugar transport system substrate-binding protein